MDMNKDQLIADAEARLGVAPEVALVALADAAEDVEMADAHERVAAHLHKLGSERDESDENV